MLRDELEKDELKKLKKDSVEEKILIPEPLYRWYLQQNLNLKHKSKNRTHFCLLYLIQLYISNQLKEHTQDVTSIVLADKYKDLIKCNSTSFNKLFEQYFDLTVEGSKTVKCKPKMHQYAVQKCTT